MCVRENREAVVGLMQANIWWKDFPGNRGEFLESIVEGRPQDRVEQELIALVDKHFGAEPAVLAGNSIYNDRMFIKKYMPVNIFTGR